jgi:hypothetical protein
LGESGDWDVRSQHTGGQRGSEAGLQLLAEGPRCACVREERGRGDIFSACQPSSRRTINAPNFPAAKGREEDLSKAMSQDGASQFQEVIWQELELSVKK